MSATAVTAAEQGMGRQWRRRARTRARLLSAARRLVAEHGLDGVTMSDVTAAADLGTGTIYNYFATFEELSTALIHAEIDALGDQLDTLVELTPDPAEVYAASLRHLVLHAISDPLWGRFYVQLGVAHPLVLEVLGPRCRRDLEQGVAQGRFQVPDVDLAVAATFGALAGVLNLVNTGPGNDDAGARYAEGMLRMVGVGVEEAAEVVARPLPEITRLEDASADPSQRPRTRSR